MFLNTPWDLWAAGADYVLPKPAVKDEDMNDAVIAQQDKNVRLLGAQAAFDVAVDQGEIDDQTQQAAKRSLSRDRGLRALQ